MAKQLSQAKLDGVSVMDYRVIFRGEAEKLNPNGTGILAFELGMDDKSDALAIRLCENQAAGLFSSEWIAVPEIAKVLTQQKGAFSSKVFSGLFGKRSRNNTGFLAAVLRSPDICLIEAAPDTLFMHQCFPNLSTRLEQLIRFLTPAAQK